MNSYLFCYHFRSKHWLCKSQNVREAKNMKIFRMEMSQNFENKMFGSLKKFENQ